MATDTQKILIDIEVKSNQLVETKKQIEDLKKRQSELKKETDYDRVAYEQLTQQIRILNADAREQQKAIDNTIKLNKSEQESMKALEAQVSLMTDTYKKMSKEQRNSAEGVALKNSINEIKSSLNGANEGIGNFQAQVGNYKNKIQEALGISNGYAGSIIGITKRYSEARDEQKKYNDAIDIVKKSTNGVQVEHSKLTEALKITGGELKEVNGTYQVIEGNTKKLSNSFIDGGVNSAKAYGKALLSLATNPIVATLAVIATVVMLIVEAMRKNGEVMKNVSFILAPFKAILESVFNIFTSFVKVLSDGVVWLENMTISIIKHIPLLDKLAEKADEAIKTKKEEQELNKKIRDQIVETAKEELEIAELKNKSRQRDKYSIAERIQFLKQASDLEIKKSNEIAENAKIKFDIKRKQMAEEGKTFAMLTSDEKTAYRQMEADIYNAEKERYTNTLRIRAQESNLIKEEQALRSKIANDNVDLVLQENITKLDLSKKYFANERKSDAENKSIAFAKLQKYNFDVFNLEQNAERQKLKNQLYIQEITQQQYDNSLEKLNLKHRVFLKNQNDDQKEFLIERRKEIISIAGDLQNIEISNIKTKYKRMYYDLEKDSTLSEEKKYFYKIQLKKKEINDINDLEKNNIIKKYSEITSNLDSQYENELLLAKNNQRELLELNQSLLETKLKQAEKQRDENINADLISKRQYEKQVIEAQNNLNDNVKALNNVNYNTELNLALNNEDKIYQIKKDSLLKQLEATKENKDEQARLNKELYELEYSNNQRLLDQKIQIANETVSILSNIASSYKNSEDAQLQKTETSNNKKKEILQSQLDSGLISQTKYNKEVEKLDKEAEKQKAQIARKQALRDRALALANIVINTAEGISKAYAQTGILGGIAGAALIGAMGAAQTAVVLSTPIPQASRGMLIGGKKHSQGGTLIEAEQGEAIINARSTSMFRNELSAINEAGGGVKFARGGIPPFNDGGYSARSNVNTTGITKEDMRDIIKDLKIYTTVEDYRKADKKYTTIVGNGTV